MARRSPVKVGIALVLLCAFSHAQADANCRSGCHEASSKLFKLQDGTTYKYNFDSKIEISLSSAEGQKSVTEVKATVLLTQQPQCNQILRLQNVQIISSEGKKYSNIPDVEKAIRLNFHDGHLEDSICITPGDTQNSLNLKRAIASIFQANLKNGHETDVFGLCPTEVSQHKEGNVLVVQKNRNLNRCAYRESIGQEFLGTTFDPNSEIKTSPLLNGDYSARLRIKNGILEQATVEEKYLYVPFSVGNNGAKVDVETSLKFIGSSRENPQARVSQPRSIIFEDPHPVTSPNSNVNGILQAVKNTAKTIDITVGEKTASEFANLIRILRVSKRDDLLAVYSQVRAGVGFADKETGRRIYLDALLRAGNGDNVEVVLELLRNKQLSEAEQNLVYLGLSVVRHPTEGSLTAALTLLNQPQLPRNAYLGIGSLVGRYCRQHSCVKVDAVNKVVQKLVQKLGNGKAANRQQENDIIFVLKALGNTNHLNDNILPKITAIAQDKKAANRLRVTALEAYLADPCKDKLRDSALAILKDIQQDSEVRIKAYLVLAQCPNTKVGNAVKALLVNEPSYQVGGFIVSHIRNIRSSANPDKALAKQYLGSITVPNRFPFDLRKYSANNEFSYTIDTLGVANSIESNIIYSQKSFLPRSTSFNLTAEVFGHSFNFLEVETRQENLDKLLEHYFGPKGVLRGQNLQDFWNSKRATNENIVKNLKQKLEQILRTRRDITKAEIDHIGRQVQIKTNELNNDLDLDLSIKTFGSEVLFLNVNDEVDKLTPDAIIEKIIQCFNKGIDKLKHFEETLRSNLLLLDAEFAYPTSSGFPLRLGVEGSANTLLRAAGSIDVKALLNNLDTTVKISLIPSTNIEIAGRLTVDTLLVESGLKVVSTLHTSSGGDLTVNIEKLNVDVKFSLPVEQQNLFSAKHEIVFQTREWGVAEKLTNLKFAQSKEFSICLDQLNDFIGLTFCAEFNGPNLQGEKVPILPFPLSGDGKISASILREDLSHYHYRHVVYEHEHLPAAQLEIETIGKDGNKKTSFSVKLEPALLKITLTSPITTASLEGRIIVTDTEKSFSLQLLQDKNEYFGKVGVSVQGDRTRAIYRPILQYKTPENSALQVPSYHVEGEILAEHGTYATYTFRNVRLVIPDRKTISINGKLGSESDAIFADLTASDGTNSASFKGNIRIVRTQIQYNAEIKNSLNPSANVRVKGELTYASDERKNFLQVAHGGDFSDKNNIITLENWVIAVHKSDEDFIIATKNEFKYPAIEADFEFDFELKPKSVEYKLDIEYTNIKLGSELEFERDKKKEGDYELEFDIWGLDNKLDLKVKRQINGDISQIENTLDINGKKIEVNGKVRHHVKPQDLDVGSDLIIKLPTHNTPFHVVNNLKLNANEIDVAHKVTSGNQVFVDVFLKANRVGNANGSIKVNLKGQLVITGQVKAVKGAGNGDILIEIPSVKRTVKIDGTFQIQDPKYNVLLNIYPVFNQDKTKKITASTHSIISLNSIDSKNLFDIFGNKLEVNVKGSQQGDIQNGKIQGEAEVTLPNGHYLAGKLNREVRSANSVINGNVFASLEHRINKNQPGSKVSVKSHIKNTNPSENIYDVEYNLAAEKSNGQNLNVDLNVKRVPQGDASYLEIYNKIYGSGLDGPVETSIKSTVKEVSATYDARTSYKPVGSLVVNGKYASGEKQPCSGEINIAASSTSKVLRTLKVSLSGSAANSNLVDVKGQGSVYADNPNGVIIDLDLSSEVQSGDKDGRVKASIKSGNNSPYVVDATLKEIGDREYKLDVKLNTPVENLKNNRLQVHSKRNEDSTHLQSEVVLTINGKAWTSNTDLNLSDVAPSIDVQVKDPEGKLRQVLVKISNLSERQFAGQIKLVNQVKNFLLEGSVDANLESIDDFHIKVTAHSPSLKIDKYVIEAQNKPAKTGRRIQVIAKSGNKNILAGSTSYTAREEQGKLIVEGSGSFKIREETKSANFKFIKQNLVQSKNGETGVEIRLDAGIGKYRIDGELKTTNKQFRVLNSYCEERKQCVHVEIDVKTISDDLRSFHQEVEVSIDLRRLGFSHEFGLKGVSKREGNSIGDNTVEVHLQSQQNRKYQVEVYVHPNKAGISVETPDRTIILNADLLTTDVKDGTRFSSGIAFYPDKQHQPQQKSELIAFATVDAKGNSVSGEIKFTDPKLRNPLSISLKANAARSERESDTVTLILDIFDQPNKKLTIDYKTNSQNYPAVEILHINSRGLGIDIRAEETITINFEQKLVQYNSVFNYNVGNSRYNSELAYRADQESVDSHLTILNKEVYRLHSKLRASKEAQVVDSEFSYLGNKPIVTHLEVKNLNTVKYTISLKENPNTKLQINAGLIPGQIADIRAEHIKQGVSKELGHASIKLDDANLLKSDYSIISTNVDSLLKEIQGNINNDNVRAQQFSDEAYKIVIQEVKHLNDLAEKSRPNFTPVRQYYESEAQKIKDEILQDKDIKEISEFLYNVFAAISEVFGETIANFSQLVENLAHIFQNTFGKIFETLERDIFPRLKELYDSLLQAATNIIDGIAGVIIAIAAKFADIAQTYRPEFEQLLNVIGDVTKDIFDAGIRVWQAIETIIIDQGQQIYNEIKQVPAVEQLRAELEYFIQNGLPALEVIGDTVRDILNTLKEIAPTQEQKDLIQAINDYLKLKFSNQEVDDQAALNKIFKAALVVVKQIISILSGGEEAVSFQNVNLPVPISIWNKLPRLAAIRFSPLSYLLREEGLLPEDFLLSLVNTPRNLVPPFPLYGLIAQGQHIFTFDGKHLTFPGKCNYLLARDAVEGNFTVAGTYTNGLLTAISLTQGPNTITLKKGGQLLLNNAPSEYPVRKPSIAAFRNPEKITLISDYGVRVICGPQLDVCSVKASGFYHGKLRGLLGNGNNEPYDDFTLPSGKIVSAESEFGNGYKLTSGCPAVQTVSHTGHHPAPTCDKLFGWESSLSLCYPFVDVANFKLGCEHGVASGVKGTESAIAVAYVAACNQHGIPVRVPAEYVKCKNGDKPVNVGDTFSVKTPGKAADIVLLVNTNKENEQIYKEYVQPLVQQLTSELNSKGVNDLEFHLIAYGGENQWPSHVTINNGKLVFKGKAPNLKFSDDPKSVPFTTSCKPLDGLIAILTDIGYDIQLAVGLDLQSRTYVEGLQYPFRANAIKTIIAVVQKPCEVGRLYPLQALRAALLRENSIKLNLITPIARSGAKADAKNIVGFNYRDVPAIGATKNKIKSYTDLSKVLEYDDYCIDFTIQNNGNVFVADHFLLQPKNTRKQFVTLASHTIVNQLIGAEEGFDCECRYISPYTASPDCDLVYSKPKATTKKASTKS